MLVFGFIDFLIDLPLSLFGSGLHFARRLLGIALELRAHFLGRCLSFPFHLSSIAPRPILILLRASRQRGR